MPNRHSKMVHSSTLEALQSQLGPSRRTRPPDIDEVADENRVPLRSEKASRRESRLGLRNIFGRSKAPKEIETVKEVEAPTFPQNIAEPIAQEQRSPVAEKSNWSYSQSAPALNPGFTTGSFPFSMTQSSRPLSTMVEAPQPGQIAHDQVSIGAGRQRGVVGGKSVKGSMGSWHLPPLFKAFPQAIKYMTLPATSIPADTLLRFYDRKTNVISREEPAEPATPSTTDGDRPAEREKSKKKHRRNTSATGLKFEWVNKIFVLVTSGYLLQYSGEGAFDRLPEKVLQLGKNSAAFASDVLPGRHWVIQVSSVMDSDGMPASDSRSLFSRLPFRASDRRQASNFLMVFETVEDMEGWIAILRREIEALGGKRPLSETGMPKAQDDAAPLRQQTSQRTLIVRDRDHLSRRSSQEGHWQGSAHQNATPTPTDSDLNNDQAVDDMSTTNSFVSQDGRQLDSLRDSSNRLSFISSGQRTVVTSPGSSPECSPTVDSFPTSFEEKRQEEASTQAETRLRPNAAAISNRRQSMQTLGPFVDIRPGMANMRPQSSYGSDMAYPHKTPTPNFSVPHSSNRRFSYARNTPLDPSAFHQSATEGGELYHRTSIRKGPPTTLPIARPLSMVADQPSPMEEMQQRPATRHGDDTAPLSPTDPEIVPLPRLPKSYDASTRRPSLTSQEESQSETNRPATSRRLSSMRSRRKSENPMPSARTFVASVQHPPPPRMRSHSILSTEDEWCRHRSSLELHSSPRSDTASVKSRMLRRASMQSCHSEKASLFSISTDLPAPLDIDSLPSPLPPPSVPLPPIPNSASNNYLKVDMRARALFNRRSMPQLGDVPPPLPPPTCALPPIPQRAPFGMI